MYCLVTNRTRAVQENEVLVNTKNKTQMWCACKAKELQAESKTALPETVGLECPVS